MTVFLIPSLLITLSVPSKGQTDKMGLILIVGIFMVWMGVLSNRFWKFNKEAQDFHKVLSFTEDNKKLISTIREPDSAMISRVCHTLTLQRTIRSSKEEFLSIRL